MHLHQFFIFLAIFFKKWWLGICTPPDVVPGLYLDPSLAFRIVVNDRVVP
jgi:hypothetical protein